MSLAEYVTVRRIYCQNYHKSCSKCEPLLRIAELVLSCGYAQLAVAFKASYPTQTYRSDVAISRLLQMPLVCIKPNKKQMWMLVEFVEGTNYSKFALFADAMVGNEKAPMSKAEVKSLLGVAQSERERKLIRYSIFKASGLSYTAARKVFGFQDMENTEKQISSAIAEAKEICEAIDDLTKTEDLALLSSMGVDVSLALSSSESDSGEEDNPVSAAVLDGLPDTTALVQVLEKAHYNWFQVLEYVEGTFNCSIQSPHIIEYLKEKYSEILSDVDNHQNQSLLQQSYSASLALCDVQHHAEKRASAMNGEIISTSEDEADVIESISSHQAKKIIERRRRSLARKATRRKAKALADKRFLSRKVSKKVKSVSEHFPDIGTVIETYVQSCDVGADKWRRTGVLTFDGNEKMQKKVTFQKIREHLCDTYNQTFSYGTVVQLYIARNKRHRAAKNYHGVAKVTSRRAHKGFQLKLNPDAHWSSAFYKALDFVQFKDGTNVTIVNRDDAAGYRLDTLATNSQHRTLVVRGKQTVTTHTDYINRYPSVLQTTNYNFTGTKTTGELCAGIVKPVKIFPKNPAQHFADLKMLSSIPELQPAFINPISGDVKEIECIRVDGAGDKGPAHLEVQFWWTVRHIEEKKLITMVTSRSSGSSFLNRVELQNGCLALAHANLFIPSTLNGMPINTDTGLIDYDILTSNLNQAADIYIERVNHCPCGDTNIHIFKDADSTELQKKRTKLMTFLKGSQKKKDELCSDDPELFKYFQQIWSVRENHMHLGLPMQYIFLLMCCFKQNCHHPVCQEGRAPKEVKWYSGGPNVERVLLPVSDPNRPFGDSNCKTCTESCSGHFLPPEELITSVDEPMLPPSLILKKFFSRHKGTEPSEDALTSIAEKTLLSLNVIRLWLNHLKTVEVNRKRGAAKAAATRRIRAEQEGRQVEARPRKHKRLQAEVEDEEEGGSEVEVGDEQEEKDGEYHCGVCCQLYEESTEEEELWIACDVCLNWHHAMCVEIDENDIPEDFVCFLCQK